MYSEEESLLTILWTILPTPKSKNCWNNSSQSILVEILLNCRVLCTTTDGLIVMPHKVKPDSRVQSMSSAITKEIEAALSKINDFLSFTDLNVALADDGISNGCYVGEYEHGSVFEKTILIRVSSEALEKESSKLNLTLTGLLRETRITVYHEAGHGLMEQLLDWADSFPVEMSAFEHRYYDIFNDDNMTEEEIVEAFARRFDAGASSLLQSCFVNAYNSLCASDL